MTRFSTSFLLVFCSVTSLAFAREPELLLDPETVIAESVHDGRLDGSISFHFFGQPTPALAARIGDASAGDHARTLGKSAQQSCRVALVEALTELQTEARASGADVIVDLRSGKGEAPMASASQVHCRTGRMMATVELRGTFAKLAGKKPAR